MRFIDLSHTIEPDMARYPGTPGPLFQPLSSIREDGFSERLLTLSSHTGTHVDLPSHMLSDASSLDAFSVGQFAGKGAVIDVSGCKEGMICVETLTPFRSLIESCEFLLLSSGWSRYWGTSRYYENYPVLSLEAAAWLTGFGLKGVGVDMISVDAPGSTDFSVHKVLLRKGVIMIENLAEIPALLYDPFIFYCFPLKIMAAEASPVRAVAQY